MGVSLHFTRGHERELDMIRDAGFRVIRMDLSWDATERVRGEYDWSAYDELLANLEQRALRPLLILDYSNRHYEPSFTSVDPHTRKQKTEVASPRSDAGIAAFTRWAAAAAAHFRGRRVIWEIWNEPNITFGKPELDARDYARLAVATARAIRAADPDATVVGPAASDFPWAYLQTLFESGGLEAFDGVTVHPYRPGPPDSVPRDYRRLQALIERFVPPDRRRIPVLCGEWGYSTYRNGGVSPGAQAAYAVRMQLVNAWQNVPLTLWYDWRDDGTDPFEREHHFGLVDAYLHEAPAYAALKTLGRELGSFRLARRLNVGSGSAWVLLCVDAAGDQKLVAWFSDRWREVALPLPSVANTRIGSVTDGSPPPRVDSGRLVLTLTESPQYVTFSPALPFLSAAAAWQITGNPPTLVEAGASDAVRFAVEVENPFATPVRIRIRATGLEGAQAQPAEFDLGPRERRAHSVIGTVIERAAEGTASRVEVTFTLPDGTRFTSDERLDFVLTNPLTLEFAPSREGIRAVVENPAGTPLGGRLDATDSRETQPLPEARGDSTVLLSRAARGRVELRDKGNRYLLATAVPRFEPLEAASYSAKTDGDVAVAAEAALQPDGNPPPGAPFGEAWRLDYAFSPGWKFVECQPHLASGERPELPAGVTALGVWVYGDGSGHALRTRVIDETGQIFQPSGPPLHGPEWKWIRFDLSRLRSVDHWGGANDGVPHGRLSLDTLLVVDSTRSGSRGTLYFAGPHWIIEKNDR